MHTKNLAPTSKEKKIIIFITIALLVIITAFYANSLSTSTFGNLIVTGNLIANGTINFTGPIDLELNWTKLQNFPQQCPDNTYLIALNDSVTCTAITNFTDNVTFEKDVIVEGILYGGSAIEVSGGLELVDGIFYGDGSGIFNLSNITSVDGNITINGDVNMINHTIIEYHGSPTPDYDSGLVSIGQGEFKTLNHNVGGNASNYVVDVIANNNVTKINNLYVGLDKDGVKIRGYYFLNLNASEIQIYRSTDDIRAEEIWVRIWKYD